MELDEFREEFYAQIGAYAAADENFTHSAFVDVCARYLEDAGEVTDFQPCFYRGKYKQKNVGVDGYSFDKADDSLRVFIAEPTFDPQATLIQTEARAIFGRLTAFVEEAMLRRLQDGLDDNSPAMAFADQLADAIQSVSGIRAYLLADASLSQRVKDWPEGSICGIPVDFHIWDITRFYRACSALSGCDELVIEFEKNGCPGIPCLYASTEGGNYTGYLCVISGIQLVDIYDLYGSRLLEGNVRSFLSAKGKINKGIRNSALHEPDMFFAYNNGIAATASAVKLTQREGGTYIAAATDLQIVNGGQTTASLAAARRNDKADVTRTFIPMKLSVIDAARSVEMIPLISRYANSQNKVSDADFFSNHQFHRRLEQISRRVWAPAKSGSQHETHWFYERARGQYINETVSATSAEKRRFTEINPRDQVITKTDLAKSENSWDQLPQRVSRGAQSNFIQFAERTTAQWDKDETAFNEEYFRNVVARLILFRTTERIVSHAAWYSGGYRANVVTHAVAKMAFDIDRMQKKTLDFRSVWQRQSISDAVAAQVALYAEAVYGIIVTPPAGHQNVTQWCKREECWERAQQADVAILPEFSGELVDRSEIREEQREARSLQRLDDGIDAQSLVVSLGHDYWQEFLTWGTVRGFVVSADEGVLRVAAGLSAGIPTDKQSKRLLLLQKRFEEEGFRPHR